MQNRWKSKTMWAGIISAIILAYNAIAENFGLPTLVDGSAEVIVNLILTGLAAFGVVNNPTDADKL